MEVYHYKIFKSNWFISIKLYAEILEKVDNENYQKVCDGLWIRYREKIPSLISLPNADRRAIERGLFIVSNEILSSSKYSDKTVIEILDVVYDFLYFQENGLTIATMHWAAQAFGFEPKEINEEYDREKKQYIFEYKGEYL